MTIQEHTKSAQKKSFYPLSTQHKQILYNFLDKFVFSNEQYEHSYQSWAKGGKGWDRTFATGGTYTMKAIMWYHVFGGHGTKECRPRVIMNALCRAAGITAAA